MAETHVELNQFPVPRVGPRHSTKVTVFEIITSSIKIAWDDVMLHL